MNAHVDPKAPPAREVLRAKIVARDAAAAAVAAATETAGRAKQLLDVAQRRLDALGDVDGAIAAYRADAYKAWAADGGERPALDVPPELAERQRARGFAAEELAAARAAHDALEAERASAVRAHGRAGDAAFDAAKQVLVEEAERIAAELEEALRQVFALHDDLHAGPHRQLADTRWNVLSAEMGQISDMSRINPGARSRGEQVSAGSAVA